MAKTSSVVLSFTVTGDGILAASGWSQTNANAASPDGGLHPITTISGDITLAMPSGAKYLVIVPPTSSTIAKKLKGVSGDTGIAIDNGLPLIISVKAGSTYLLNAAGAETVYIAWL